MINCSVIGAMVLPNAGGWVGSLPMAGQVTSKTGISWYYSIKRPYWNPPRWTFKLVWIVLYTWMGYASYKVYKDCGGFTEKAMVPLSLYGGQLLMNWTWTTIFFKYHKMGLALFHMLVLDAVASACTVSFYNTNKTTIYFMMPYLAWLSFATFLNYTIWKLNKVEVDGESINLQRQDKSL